VGAVLADREGLAAALAVLVVLMAALTAEGRVVLAVLAPGAQAAVPVCPGDTETTLAARVLTAEHRLYPLALKRLAENRARLEGDRQQFRALYHQGALGASQTALPQQLPDPPNPMVGRGESGLVQGLASALVRASVSASLATCTNEANASGSVTARSARTLRSTSTSARCSPAMSRL